MNDETIQKYKKKKEEAEQYEKEILKNLGDLIDERKLLLEDRKSAEGELIELKQAIEQIETEISRIFNQAQLEELEINDVRIKKNTKISYKVVNWESFWAWLMKLDRVNFNPFLFLKKNIHTTNINKFSDEYGSIPDGLIIDSYEKIEFKNIQGE